MSWYCGASGWHLDLQWGKIKVKPKIYIQINKYLVCSGISSWRGGRDSTKIMILLQACLKDQDRVVLSKWGETAAFGIIVSELEKYHVPLLFLFFNGNK